MRRLHERYLSAKSGKRAFLFSLILALALLVSACGKATLMNENPPSEAEPFRAELSREEPLGKELPEEESERVLSVEEIVNSFEGDASVEIPGYTGDAYTVMNDNTPYFTRSNLPTSSFEYYSYLDELGRCGVACANIGQDIMPTEERGNIGQIKPSGWQTIKYDLVDGKYLYNRCHLIGYQLSAENANEKNLITGTRYFNVQGMLPFENMVADYVKETGNHVLYRVMPVFDGEDLVAHGVLIEGWSVEDAGESICFNVFVHNVQPGIVIDYANGNSHLEESRPSHEEAAEEPEPDVEEPESVTKEPEPAGTDYILNTNTKKFHDPACRSVKQMEEKNKELYTGNREDVIAMGYAPCKNCNP